MVNLESRTKLPLPDPAAAAFGGGGQRCAFINPIALCIPVDTRCRQVADPIKPCGLGRNIRLQQTQRWIAVFGRTCRDQHVTGILKPRQNSLTVPQKRGDALGMKITEFVRIARCSGDFPAFGQQTLSQKGRAVAVSKRE